MYKQTVVMETSAYDCTKEEFICGICEKLYDTGELLTEHLQTHTGQGSSYTFEMVSEEGMSNSSPAENQNEINMFIKDETSDMIEYVPSEDGIDATSFNYSNSRDAYAEFERLKSTENDKSFENKLSKKTFKAQNQPTEHSKTHKIEKRFPCEYCEKSFKNKAYLKEHTRIHTGHKPFSCDVCDKTFTTKRLQQQHIRTHTGDKPFVCPICDKRFTKNQNLQHHARTHTGEKPYTCDICQKSFSQQSYLKIHVWKHSNSCDVDPFSG